jgi:hypothetical protein
VDIEEPIVGQYASAFHFHATLAGVLGPALVREQVVEVCQPSQQRLLAATGMSDDVQMVKIQWCVKEQNQRECLLWG